MNRVSQYIMALALMLGSALYGSAQTVAYSGGGPAIDMDRQGYSSYLTVQWDDRRDSGEGRRIGERLGFEDGLNDGRTDFYRGHSFRPTHSGNFKHADRGYEHRFGDKGVYKDLYRRAYDRGYDQGYRERGHGEWGRR